jgi:hypothetical protein
MTEIKLHEYDNWATDWSHYVGEEDLGKVRIARSRFGMHTSYHESGKELVTAIELDQVVSGTYWYLKWKRDGYVPPVGMEDVKVYDSIVGGKL